MRSNPVLEYEEHGADEAYEEACADLRHGVLAKYYAARAEGSRQQYEYARRNDGVEVEQRAECHEGSHQSAHAHHVGAYLPPCVYHDAYNLRHQCRHDYASEEHGHLHVGHQYETSGIAYQREYVRQVPVLAMTKLHVRPFIDYTEEVINSTNDFCVYILCGFPGCGKSTYYKEFLADKPIISRDIIRGELGIDGATTTNDKKVVGTKEEEDKVSEIFNKKMIEYCENKESFVLDNTNLKYQYRKDYLLRIMKYNPKVKIIYIEAPNYIKDCIDRRKGEIPKKVYDRMEHNFDFPQLYECDELIIVKQHTDSKDEIHTFKGDFTPDSAYDINIANGRDYISKVKVLNDLYITRGAMILDGYDCYDSCVKYMDELISTYESMFSEIPLKND